MSKISFECNFMMIDDDDNFNNDDSDDDNGVDDNDGDNNTTVRLGLATTLVLPFPFFPSCSSGGLPRSSLRLLLMTFLKSLFFEIFIY